VAVVLWELVLTFFLMFVITAVATDTRAVGEAAAIAIGGTVGLDAMFGGPISGASMNPARSIGPALVSGDLHAQWLYIVAPLLGAAAAALAYQLVRGERSDPAQRHELDTRGAATR
jgi:glycerol uptake facilitator-like aquaporin